MALTVLTSSVVEVVIVLTSFPVDVVVLAFFAVAASLSMTS